MAKNNPFGAWANWQNGYTYRTGGAAANEAPEENVDPQVKALREKGFDDDFISDMLDYADYLKGTSGRKSDLEYFGYLNDKYYRDAEAEARTVLDLLGLDPRTEEGQEMGRALIEYSLSGNEKYQDNKTKLENEKERISAEEQKKKNEQKRDQVLGGIAEGARYANGAPSDAEISFWQNVFSGNKDKPADSTGEQKGLGYYGSAPTTVPGAPGYMGAQPTAQQSNSQSPVPGLSQEELDGLFTTARNGYSGSANAAAVPGPTAGPVNQPPVLDWADAYTRYSRGT